MAMDRLRELDQIAYIRFASVYESFEDLDQLQREVNTLMDERKQIEDEDDRGGGGGAGGKRYPSADLLSGQTAHRAVRPVARPRRDPPLGHRRCFPSVLSAQSRERRSCAALKRSARTSTGLSGVTSRTCFLNDRCLRQSGAMAVLSDRDIRAAMQAGRVRIDPYDAGCLQPSSVDLHLDADFGSSGTIGTRTSTSVLPSPS